MAQAPTTTQEEKMNALLESAVAAHGGLDRWQRVKSITVEASISGTLQVTFPDDIKSHTRQQTFCFGPDGLLRRHDFSIDILGGVPSMLYATDYRDVDGIVIPTTRRAWQGDEQHEPPMVAIDMGEITMH
jgi:hypothetical protein